VGIVLIALMVAGIKRILSGLLGRSLPRTTSDRRPNPRSQQRRGPRPASSSSATNDLSRTSASHALASARERQGAALRPDSLAAVLALGGLIVYTLLYVAALRFYRPLGVSPTDVGLDYGTLLAQCAFTVVAPLTAAALVILVVAVFANRVGRLHHSEPRGAHGADRRALWPAWASPRAKRFLAVVLLVYLILYFGVGLAFVAEDESDQIRLGRPPATTLLGIASLPWSGEIVTVDWTQGVPIGVSELDAPLRDGSCMVYLGGSNGSIVLYDPLADRAMHVGTSAARVAVQPEGSECFGRSVALP
jgi:hypothetical protein